MSYSTLRPLSLKVLKSEPPNCCSGHKRAKIADRLLPRLQHRHQRPAAPHFLSKIAVSHFLPLCSSNFFPGFFPGMDKRWPAVSDTVLLLQPTAAQSTQSHSPAAAACVHCSCHVSLVRAGICFSVQRKKPDVSSSSLHAAPDRG